MANINIKEALATLRASLKKYVDDIASKKVDKKDGYSLMSDSEINRLKDVTNYDDSRIQAVLDRKIEYIPPEYIDESELTGILSNYSKTGHTHSQYATTSYVTSQLQNITGGSNVPSYVVTEAQMVANKVIEKRNAYSLVISAMSDLHTSGTDTSATGVLHAFQGINEIDKITEVDLITIHGDVMVGYMDDTYKDAFKYVKTCMNEVTKNMPLVQMQGNHDELSTDSTEIARQKYFRYIGSNNKDVVTDFNARYGNYGYKDFDDLRIRFIYLNSADCSEEKVTGNNWITPQQFNWFINTALDFSDKEGADDWQWIVGTHHPLNANNIMTNLKNILIAYNSRTSGSFSYNDMVNGTATISYNFANAKQKLICHTHGHIHNFRTDWYDSVLSITVPNACFGRNNEYGTHSSYSDQVHQDLGDIDENGNQRQYNKVSNSANDTAFVTLVIDARVNNKIYAYCYGAGIDREIDLTTKEVKYIDKVTTDEPDTPVEPDVPTDSFLPPYATNLNVPTLTTDSNPTPTSQGWIKNARINSSNAITTADGYYISNIIDIDRGGTLYIDGMDLLQGYSRIYWYHNGAYITSSTTTNWSSSTTYFTNSTATSTGGTISTDDVFEVVQAHLGSNATVGKVSVRFGGILTSTIEDVVIYTEYNLVPKSTTLDGTAIYNTTGYKDGCYVSSEGGGDSSDSACTVTGLFNYPTTSTTAPTIYVYGATIDTTNAHIRMGYFKADNTFIGVSTATGMSSVYTLEILGDKYYKLVPVMYSETQTGVYHHYGNVAKLRMSFLGTGENLVIWTETPITNFVTTSIDSSGATFGYQNDKYVSSSGATVSAKTGYVATGFMKLPRTFYVKGVEWIQDDTACRMVSYSGTFEKIGAIYGNNQNDGTNGLTLTRMDNGVIKFELTETNAGFKTGAYTYIRMSFKGTGESLIISDIPL